MMQCFYDDIDIDNWWPGKPGYSVVAGYSLYMWQLRWWYCPLAIFYWPNLLKIHGQIFIRLFHPQQCSFKNHCLKKVTQHFVVLHHFKGKHKYPRYMPFHVFISINISQNWCVIISGCFEFLTQCMTII